MGFVYNNPIEALCKTFLELNGWFVQTNFFSHLLYNPTVTIEGSEKEKEEGHYKYDADIVATKPPKVTLIDPNGEPLLADKPYKNCPPAEFFAGIEKDGGLIYCEVKGNFLDSCEAQVNKLLNADRGKVDTKRTQIERRYNEKPRVVIMAYNIEEHADKIPVKDGWYYKDLKKMFCLLYQRFRKYPKEKLRAAYNDPWLEMAKFVYHAFNEIGCEQPFS